MCYYNMDKLLIICGGKGSVPKPPERQENADEHAKEKADADRKGRCAYR